MRRLEILAHPNDYPRQVTDLDRGSHLLQDVRHPDSIGRLELASNDLSVEPLELGKNPAPVERRISYTGTALKRENFTAPVPVGR